MTFEDKRYLLVSVAKRYVGYRYEIDELVNEAWLNMNVQEQTDKPLFWKAARWAMLNYMRRQEKRGRKKWRIHTEPLTVGEDEYIVEPEITPFNEFDYAHDFAWLCRGLTRQQRLVVKMRLNGYSWREIAHKTNGTSGEYARQIAVKAFKIMRSRAEQGML